VNRKSTLKKEILKMNSHEIEQNIKQMMEHFSNENFLYNLLLAYGISKASVTRLKSGDFNLSKVEGEILYKKKIFFKQLPTDKLLSSIESLAKEERIVKHSPRFAVVTDYKTLVAKDIKLGRNLDIPIHDLHNHYAFFLPLAGSEIYQSTNDNEADRNAAYKMAQLYDLLITQNPQVYHSKETVHELNIFLSRLLFCFFAEDTEIFEGDSIFTNTLYQHTNDNGNDTHLFLDRLFDRLNTENAKGFPAHLAQFPYVNGGLFRDKIASPVFNAKARKILVELGELNWRDINPDIFGSMIQAVVIPEYRSDLGMHYTSVPNIQKLIKPLFLDALYDEFENCKTIPQLRKLINRIAKIKFFDPACGSGNFLIITYKEIRLLEIKILQRIIDLSPKPAMEFTSIQLAQFYGIELDDFAHEMAILSLWLAEHQMNKYFDEQLMGFGQSKPILPLKQAGKIVQGNAARVDWKTVCPIGKEDEVYVIGNPPYLGYKGWDSEQKKDMSIVFNMFQTVNRLDYISCWFKKGADYIKGNNVKLAFVSTNSICQGEQVSLIWPYILKDLEINFAYTSFKWTNNAKGSAGVSVVIISLRNINETEKIIYDSNIKTIAKNINPYLTAGNNIFIQKRERPLSNLPEMALGSSGIDGGHLILSEEERAKFLKEDLKSEEFIRRFLGGNDFLNGVDRYCLWIDDDKINQAYDIKSIKSRIDKCEQFRLNAGRDAQKAAEIPYRFFYRKYQSGESLIIPMTSSSNRNYLPVGIEQDGTILSNGMFVIYDFSPFHFGILSSTMHLIWTKAVGGKMREDIRYSVSLIYNTFPFPDITLKQKENLNLYVFAILDERAKHPEKTMAQLYDPDKMPKGLKQAHEELDRAVEQCYRLQPFTSDTERLEYLFKLYEEMTKSGTLFEKQKAVKKAKKK
jgi:hypothetical protein